ncbi:MAG TPA: acetyl-CoA carboxylase, carboxyltransferase subunit beta [Polyangia bacterium]
MPWYQRDSDSDDENASEKRSVPVGVFTKCPGCREALLTTDLRKNHDVCPKCQHHFLMGTRDRIALMLDENTIEEVDPRIESIDPLGFRDSKKYPDRVRAARRSAGTADALISVRGLMDGIAVEAGFFAFEFMGGSMGSVVGEKITRVFERALDRRVPALIFCASGGARMQEGVLSLMQMAKTSAAISRLRAANVPLISVLLHPTTGGVAASFAMLGDFIVAEPKALIGFAGARVIQNTIRQSLPPGFQRAEFLLSHGFVDAIAHRHELKATLVRMLRFFTEKPAAAAAQP